MEKEEDESESEESSKENFKLHQKKETPPEDDPSRIFYETLYREKPDSHLAIKYCLDYGLIEDVNEIKRAAKILEKAKSKGK